ncbi:response regulator [Saccharothrix algeriensis]|uniref:DNA-binding NarL/FixJ family response regulator n=1 Tax=Saccharothrix algeriensis TaxID=173560 RepID=A0A8T8HVX9_9PSEU|nr:response regulator transcription factor [Saccharothrix algeriensis]MBM7814192.1 DNA-binding NarL/FixJ family response regulator [Saccharothrix algeriensis]QTR02557.1 response regulator transcription factor [Saccharothrix algeriensis]
MTRVLICDDDPMIAEALHDVLTAEPDLAVVAVARTAGDAIALAERHSPDVVVLDLRMPGGGGLRVARELGRRCPQARVVAFSAHADPAAVAGMRRAGVTEYLVKGVPNAVIVDAVRRLG